MSQDRNPYYDSARDKPDRSEFASLRMDIQQPKRSSSGGRSWVSIVVVVVGIVIIAAVAKRFLLA